MSDALTIQAVLRLNVAEFVAALTRARQQFSGAMGDLSGAAAGVDLSDTFADVEQGAERSREAIDELGASLGELGAGSADGLTDLAEAQADLAEAQAGLTEQAEAGREALEESGESAEGFGGRLRDLAAGLLSLDALGNIFSAIAEQIGELAALADAWSNLQAKLKLVTDSEKDAAAALAEVQGIAQQTASDLTATGDLYATLSRALKSLGDTSTNVADLTRTIAQSFQISGASAAESEGAITQLAQALGSGVLRGDEFNSVMEQAPRLSQALADSLGVTTGQLREQAEEGKLTAQTVIQALTDQADTIAAEAATLPDTFERSTTRLKNSLTAMVGGLNEALRGSELFAAGSGVLADALSGLAGAIEALGGFLVALANGFAAIPAPIYAAIAAMTVTGGALLALSLNLATVTGALTTLALGITSIALAAWQALIAQLAAVGTALRALWTLMLANPLTALAAALGVVAAGWMAFSAASEESAASLATLRDETKKQSDELATLQRTLATAKPGTEAYTEAARRLAQLVPDLTLSLDEHGVIVAGVGQGYEDNAKKIAEFAAELKKTDQEAMIRQLGESFRAQQEAKTALEAHTQALRENYGIGQEHRTGIQEAFLMVERWVGGIDRANARTADLNVELQSQTARWRALAIEALNSGLSVEQITEALQRAGESKETIDGVVAALKTMQAEALKAQGELTESQKAVAEAGTKAGQQVKAAAEAVGQEIEALDKKIDEHRKKLEEAQSAETAGWKALGEEAKSAYDGVIAELDEVTQAQREAIDAATLSEREAAGQRAALYQQDAQSRIAATQQYQQQALALIEEEGARRKAAARASGESVRAIDLEILQAKRAALQEIESAYRAHIDQLNAEAKRHLEAVKQGEEQIRQLKLSTEDRIREFQRGAMTEYAAYQDRRRQLDETTAQAKQALAEGNYTLAKELAQKEMELAAQLAREVKDGEKVYVSKQQAATNASTAYLAGSQRMQAAIAAENQAHQQQAQSAKAAADTQQTALDGVIAKLNEIATKLAVEIKIKLTLDQGKVNAEVAALETTIGQKEVLVPIKTDLEALKKDLDRAGQLARDNPVKLAAKLDEGNALVERLKSYAKQLGDKAPVELKAVTTSLEAALKGAREKFDALEKPTTSTHTVQTNAPTAKAEVQQLNQQRTTSTHTVQTNVPAAKAEVQQLNQQRTTSVHTVQGDVAKTQALAAAESQLAAATAAYAIQGERARAGDVAAAAAVAKLGNDVLAARDKVAALTAAQGDSAEAANAAARASGNASVTYGEWRAVSGEVAAKQQALATAVGVAGEKVREIGRAYQEAANYNAKFSPEFDAAGADKLKQELEAAKAEYVALKTELEQSVPKVEVETDTTQVEGAKVKIQEIDGVKTYSDHDVKTNVSAALAAINSLDGNDTSSTHTIYVKKVETNAAGGLVGLALRFASGGTVPDFLVPRWSTVPGVGNTDSVPAALEPGSYVLKKSATRYYGPTLLDLISRFASGGRVPSLLMPGERLFQPDTVSRLGVGFFDALNQMRLPREQILAAVGNLTAPLAHFADGGAVGAKPAPVASAGGERESIDFNLQIGRHRVQLQGPRDQAKALVDALHALQRQM